MKGFYNTFAKVPSLHYTNTVVGVLLLSLTINFVPWRCVEVLLQHLKASIMSAGRWSVVLVAQ